MIKALLTIPILLFLAGCKSTAPTAFERTFAHVETNYVPRLALQTNVVTVVQTNVQVVTVTNQVGVVVPEWRTNLVVAYQTNAVTVTNQVPVYVMTPNDTARATAGAAGTATNLIVPGIGGLVSSGLLGALSIWFGIRNRQFANKNDALSQSAGTLAQIIETGREVMSTTPQGQQAANAFTQWMVSHQAETDTIKEISQVVKDSVDNEQAKKAADQILALMNPTPPRTG